MYSDIFGPMRWIRISALSGAVFTTLFYTSMAVSIFILATPHKDETWLSHESTKHAVLRFSVPQSAVGLAIDVFILILPIATVSKSISSLSIRNPRTVLTGMPEIRQPRNDQKQRAKLQKLKNGTKYIASPPGPQSLHLSTARLRLFEKPKTLLDNTN